MIDNVLCTICARGGSKGVKNKNVRSLLGKPLIAHTVESAKESNLFSHVVISSDSQAIQEAGKRAGADVFFTRDKILASDISGKLPVIQDCLKRSEDYYNEQFDYIIDLDATSPLRDAEDIINAYNFIKEKGAGNLITGAPSRRSPYFNLVERSESGAVALSKPPKIQLLRRQDSPQCYDMNASIYIWKREVLITQTTIFLPDTVLYVMPEERSIDIDSELDFMLVEFLMGRKTSYV
jgi:CMP-N-acetylneuraminic acid synthetase